MVSIRRKLRLLKLNDNKYGFTLIEIIVVMAISSVIGIILCKTLSSYNRLLSLNIQRIEMERNAIAIIDTIGFYIMNTGYDSFNKGIGPNLNNSNENSMELSFPLDKNKNGIISPGEAGEIAVFYFDKERGQLFKNNVIFSEDIIDITFQYLPTLKAPKSILLKVVTRTTDEDPYFKNGYNLKGTNEDGTCHTFILESRVAIRNV